MKTIREIAKNANFKCTIDRHGVYTNYTLERNGRILYIEHTNKKVKNVFHFSANGPIEDTTKGNYVYQYETATYEGMTHIIANGEYPADLKMEEIETLVYNN